MSLQHRHVLHRCFVLAQSDATLRLLVGVSQTVQTSERQPIISTSEIPLMTSPTSQRPLYTYTVTPVAPAPTLMARKPGISLIRSFASMSSMMSRIHRFESSMESVYGNFSNIADPSTWVPPPKSGGHRGRYLWTDAFGVLNFLTLHKENQSSDGKYLMFAKRLVLTVHDVLGRTRDGQSRLPGATDEEPLGGGLRIGKESETGSDGDGQYHHYLTVWMFALNRLAMAAGEPAFNRQAVSLAKAIHPHFFLNRTSSHPRMVWKVAMDLSRPLVASEGNLDPIDGYVVFRLLQSSALNYGGGPVLEEEIDDYKRVMARKGKHYVSSDTLDLGMTLWTAHWLSGREDWATDLGNRCILQIRDLFDREGYLDTPVRFRLAFREFGTCLGIGCMFDPGSKSEVALDLKSRSEEILSQWEKYTSSALTPEDLKPITRVMNSTALIPGAFKAGFFGREPIRDLEEGIPIMHLHEGAVLGRMYIAYTVANAISSPEAWGKAVTVSSDTDEVVESTDAVNTAYLFEKRMEPDPCHE
ncbi:conserved hypothetical protein [Uncinocarpus reesii 1704]|uniref:Linalool dehydratase/isomerase domain-containing protein n=1 Tax=Uncinocarpus reesii (strain UAMH 1704) TaxID=336963 RepID=C4JKB2_UNCRE|nr:uncharacterized protein UREG_02069 [Uncinocarpus reesii 1704]EEP77220.1 conserved hypothetical protein [Uncinocarpus reesii 1704]